jgi:hypothetical protein
VTPDEADDTAQPPQNSTAATLLRLFPIALATSLIVSALLFFGFSWQWPLVGDASVMHYLAFLIERGWAPYRQLGDQQFPAAYLIELVGMHIFGMSSLGWRLFDFTLLALAAAAFFAVTRSATMSRNDASAPTANSAETQGSWLPGLFAACLFLLIHGRDGLEQSGQRDFTMAVLLLGATAFLFTAVRRSSISSSAMFGLLSGLAFSIKPTVLPLSIAQLVFACYVCRRRGAPWIPHAIAAALACLIAPAISIVFLLREHAFSAFLTGLKNIVPFYAGLGHRPLTYILVHSVSPVLLMVFIWFAIRALIHFTQRRPADWIGDWERTTLLAGAVFALVDCILQARALPYYRYPLLAFLLPLMALDFYRAIQQSTGSATPPTSAKHRKLISTLALAALAFGGFVVAPQSAVLIHRYRWWETDFITTLEQHLSALGGSALSGHIQCIDSISGCPTVLYRMRLEPASGVLADYLLLGPGTIPIVRQARQQFADDIFAHPPRVIVVSSRLHMQGGENFDKLTRWPELATFLATRYTLATEWHPTRPALWWSRAEMPASYRIYVLRTPAPPHS